MKKLPKGAKKRFIFKLLKDGVKLSQESLRYHANYTGDPRLYSSRLGAYIYEFRKRHIIKTHLVPNSNCDGEHAVYEYVKPIDQDVVDVVNKIFRGDVYEKAPSKRAK